MFSQRQTALISQQIKADQEINRCKRSLTGMDQRLFGRLQHNTEEIVQLKDQMRYMQGIAKTVKVHTYEKVQVGEFRKLEERIDETVPTIDMFEELQKLVDESTSNQEAALAKQEEKMLAFVSKQEGFNEHLTNVVETNEATIDKNTLSIQQLSARISQHAASIAKVQEELKTKALSSDLEILTTRFNIFNDVEHMALLKDVFLPRIKSFAE